MNTDVSIVLPIYNIKEEYLRKCVESLLQQSKREIEIILVDDGSSNNVYSVCCEYQARDSRVKTITQKNQGVSVARNRGLKEASGEWICFVDPDDWMEQNYIEALYNAASSSNADLVQCSCRVFYTHSKIVDNRIMNRQSGLISESQKRDLMNQIISKGLSDYYPPEVASGTPWGKLIRKKLLDDQSICFIPGMVRMQDSIFSLYAFQYAQKVYYLDELLYFYRKEQNSACFRYNPNIVKQFEKFYYEVEKFQDKFDCPENERSAFKMKKLTSFNSYLLYYYFNDDNPQGKSAMRRELSNLLEQAQYKDAIQAIDKKYLKKSEYIFVTLLKMKCFRMLELMVKARNKVKM